MMTRDELYSKYMGVRNINAVLKQQNAELAAALRNMLAMAKHYKPMPDGYNPEYEDEEMWGIGMLYAQAEAALAQVKEEL